MSDKITVKEFAAFKNDMEKVIEYAYTLESAVHFYGVKALASRMDVTPALLQQWIKAGRQVFLRKNAKTKKIEYFEVKTWRTGPRAKRANKS